MVDPRSSWRQLWRHVRRRAARCAEALVWGGPARERILLALLSGHYRSRMRRDWKLADELPHFVDHRPGTFRLMLGDGGVGPYPYSRAFYAAEVVRDGDRLLDIGCGDGFFARRFFSPRCASIDAVDVDSQAIERARRFNRTANVRYYQRDAVTQPFPNREYDVVVWDGALGHFSAAAAQRVLAKIRAALAPDGIFVGSETLGREGHDHEQYFATPADLAAVLQPLFRHVAVRTATYRIDGGHLRVEAYWRCAQRRERLDAATWRIDSPAGAALENCA